ncbi:hypothetical protein K435DRAFT_741241 [Dendrothele bispora CBS 962.96]|uniref:Uncharacterized protein n=1 Tax=Dendrothele bispora (strain CBS 962.96) TaxID=1314807 RepID=A0A4S8MZ74_DENBC|nr:hypothetical protein K435DRAFT_741241 [Dendrothele bispora CBS 962.96]
MVFIKTEKPFVPLDVTEGDLVLGSVALGFFIGFAFFVTVSAVQQTIRTTRKFSGYICMLWIEIIADCIFASLSFAYLYGKVEPSLGLFVGIICCWICQVWCLMLIIVNRICLLYTSSRTAMKLKIATIIVLFLISISWACVWIPAQLQVTEKFVETNIWWDKTEKSVYLLLDAFLNALFIRTVKKRLIDHGLTKYDKVMKFNQFIIFFSIGLDVFLICMTTLHNPFVYVQFHPIVYIAKLQIEITMSKLIVKVARSTGVNVYHEPQDGKSHSTYDNVHAQSVSHGASVAHMPNHIQL